ncbi:hypothetical protein BH09VER1_BH09VER1_43640 [soil metagenome]
MKDQRKLDLARALDHSPQLQKFPQALKSRELVHVRDNMLLPYTLLALAISAVLLTVAWWFFSRAQLAQVRSHSEATFDSILNSSQPAPLLKTVVITNTVSYFQPQVEKAPQAQFKVNPPTGDTIPSLDGTSEVPAFSVQLPPNPGGSPPKSSPSASRP